MQVCKLEYGVNTLSAGDTYWRWSLGRLRRIQGGTSAGGAGHGCQRGQAGRAGDLLAPGQRRAPTYASAAACGDGVLEQSRRRQGAESDGGHRPRHAAEAQVRQCLGAHRDGANFAHGDKPDACVGAATRRTLSSKRPAWQAHLDLLWNQRKALPHSTGKGEALVVLPLDEAQVKELKSQLAACSRSSRELLDACHKAAQLQLMGAQNYARALSWRATWSASQQCPSRRHCISSSRQMGSASACRRRRTRRT
eukprot:366036-Chlamydomonas_euryale.AAC.19